MPREREQKKKLDPPSFQFPLLFSPSSASFPHLLCRLNTQELNLIFPQFSNFLSLKQGEGCGGTLTGPFHSPPPALFFFSALAFVFALPYQHRASRAVTGWWLRHLLKSSSITAHALQFSFLTVRHLQRTKYDFLPTKTKKGALEKNLRLNTKMNDNLLRQRDIKRQRFYYLTRTRLLIQYLTRWLFATDRKMF